MSLNRKELSVKTMPGSLEESILNAMIFYKIAQYEIFIFTNL